MYIYYNNKVLSYCKALRCDTIKNNNKLFFHNWIVDVRNCIKDKHNRIKDIHNYTITDTRGYPYLDEVYPYMDIHSWVMDNRS